MRGQLLLGEKRWKERRDLARPDETSSVAHCFVSWVFLSFSLQNFRSVSPSESPGPPLRAAGEKRRRCPARSPRPGPARPSPAPVHRLFSRPCPAPHARLLPRPGPPLPSPALPRPLPPGSTRRRPAGPGAAGLPLPGPEGCGGWRWAWEGWALGGMLVLEGAFLPLSSPPHLGRVGITVAAGNNPRTGTHLPLPAEQSLPGMSPLLPSGDTWAEPLPREAGATFCRWTWSNKQSSGA